MQDVFERLGYESMAQAMEEKGYTLWPSEIGVGALSQVVGCINGEEFAATDDSVAEFLEEFYAHFDMCDYYD